MTSYYRSPRHLAKLWYSGYNTAQIARLTDMPEHEVDKPDG